MPKIKYIKSKKRPSIKFKKGGKKTKMATKATIARGSGAARPQKFRKNG